MRKIIRFLSVFRVGPNTEKLVKICKECINKIRENYAIYESYIRVAHMQLFDMILMQKKTQTC